MDLTVALTGDVITHPGLIARAGANHDRSVVSAILGVPRLARRRALCKHHARPREPDWLLRFSHEIDPRRQRPAGRHRIRLLARPDLVTALAMQEQPAASAADDRNATHPAVFRARPGSCIARRIRKRTPLDADALAALLLR